MAGYETYTNTATATIEWTDGGGKTWDKSASDSTTYTGLYNAYTPGYWKMHSDLWLQYAGIDPYAKVSTIFTVPGNYTLKISSKKNGTTMKLVDCTLLQGVGFLGDTSLSGGAQILLRAAIAAVLNASATNSGTTYRYTVAEIQGLVNTALASQNRAKMITLAAELDGYNNGLHDAW